MPGHRCELSPLTCPDCGGSLSELQDGSLLRFRCHAGHACNAQQLLGAQAETVERALWSGAHEERAALLCRLPADQARANHTLAAARRRKEYAAEREEEANVIRRLLLQRPMVKPEAETVFKRPEKSPRGKSTRWD